MLEMLDAAAGSQRNEPQTHEHQFPAMYDGPQKPLLLFEGSRDYIESNAVSDILYNMPDKLSWSSFDYESWSVFWSSDYGNNDSVEGTQTISSSIIEDENEAIKWKIKHALQRFPKIFLSPLLVQFWAPISGGTQTSLSTSDLPFGLNNLPQKGPCWYRKQCMQDKYIIDDGNGTNENEFSPPGRVFSRGVLEFNPFVGNYSIKEYPLRDLALQYGATEYLALPVFESHGKRCVGVLEFLLFFKQSWGYWTQNLNMIVEGIEAVGLKSPDISLPLYDVYDVARKAFKEIEAGLKEACEAHNLPLAQIWTARGVEFHDSEVFSIFKGQSYDQREFYSSFVEACRKSRLREGEGVVGKAFSSLTSWFCKDITRLITNEYSLALDARMAELTTCFAICLRSSYMGYTNFVVEFFLPTSETACKEPWAFLDSLLATIKHHCPSFRIASGLQLGEELSVEVIRLPEDDELDSFKICQTTLSCSPNEVENIQLHSSCQQLALEVNATSNGGNTICPEQSIAALPPEQEFPPNDGDAMQLDPPVQGLSLDVNAAHGGAENVCGPKQNDTVVTPLEKEGIVKKSNWGSKITKSPPTLGRSPNEGDNIQLHSSCQQLALEVNATTNGGNTICPELSIAALPPEQEFPSNDGDAMQVDPPYQGLSLDVNAAHGGAENRCGPKQNDTVVTPLKKEGPVKTANNITREDLEQLFGNTIDVARELLGSRTKTNISRSTFKRICRKNNILKWPSCKREVKHAFSATTAKKHIAEDSSGDRPHSVLTPDKGNASNAHPLPQSTSMQNGSFMTIKARYGEDMIKFDLSLSSTMMELVDKVAKRFELQAGTFKAKYQDEDNDMILLTCDEDLRKCLSNLRSLGRPVVHIVIQPKNIVS